LAIAQELADGNEDVIVVESSSGPDADPEADQLNVGDSLGVPYTGITWGRPRRIGGGTQVWAGACIPMEPWDFDQREWVPMSGWPIAYRDVAAFYEEAFKFFGITWHGHREEVWSRFHTHDPGLDPSVLEHRFVAFSPRPQRFVGSYRLSHLVARRNATVITNAPVRRIRFDSTTDTVLSVEATTSVATT